LHRNCRLAANRYQQFEQHLSMEDNNRIEIQLSKKKLIKLLLFSLIFLAVGLWIISTNPKSNNPVFDDIVIKTVASYGATIMGLLGIYFFSKKLMDKNPGIILDNEGIYDNTSAFNFGFIPWNDISGVHERTVQISMASKQHFVTIGLINPEKYIDAEKNTLKRKLLQQNAKNYGSPVHISTNGLKTTHKELLDLIKQYFDKHNEKI
jgi:hypothetical protein